MTLTSLTGRPLRIVGYSRLWQVGAVDELGRRVHKWVEDNVLRPWCRRLRFHAQVGRHAAEFVERGRVHLVVNGLGLERHGHLGVLAQTGC